MGPCFRRDDLQRGPVNLPDPPLLLVTDRHQARLPLTEVVTAALVAGCRWVSMREKDLSADDQIALARTLLPAARRHGARLTVHGDAALAKAWGADKLIGVSIHTVTEAEAIDPGTVVYAIAGPAFETASKPGYGPEIGRKGLAEIARAARVPLLAIGGINTLRIAEVIAAGCAGVAVMGGVMRAVDPGLEVGALVATLQGSASIRAPGRS